MTPATEALVERLAQAEQVQRWAHNDPMVSLLVEAQVEIRRLSADHVSDPRQMVSPPPAGEE
jgi:hypothetical protein